MTNAKGILHVDTGFCVIRLAAAPPPQGQQRSQGQTPLAKMQIIEAKPDKVNVHKTVPDTK